MPNPSPQAPEYRSNQPPRPPNTSWPVAGHDPPLVVIPRRPPPGLFQENEMRQIVISQRGHERLRRC